MGKSVKWVKMYTIEENLMIREIYKILTKSKTWYTANPIIKPFEIICQKTTIDNVFKT